MSTPVDLRDAKARVLQCLQEAAPQALTTWTLIHLTQHSRSVGRIWELIEDGYDIEKIHLGHRTYAWKYRGRKPITQPDLFAHEKAFYES